MIQTWAMLVDSYRELNARKLFWITMLLSALVTLVIASLGIGPKGLTFLVWAFPIEVLGTFLNSSTLEPAEFYKIIFTTFGFGIWLTWAAMILALISTANIIPDFISGGAIDLTLSKPIGRLRLFVTKYCTSLLFVAAQVGVFSLLAFLVIGLRGGSWAWGLFWSVPLVVLVFSYLYSVSALVGMVTRSGMAALLVTGLVWAAIFVVNLAEAGILLNLRTQYDISVGLHTSEIEKRQKELAALESEPAPTAANSEKPAASEPQGEGKPAWAGMAELNTDNPAAERASRIERLKREVGDFEKSKAGVQSTAADLHRYHAIAFAVKTILPKTGETTELLGRVLFKGDELEGVQDSMEENSVGRRGRGQGGIPVGAVRVSQRELGREVKKEMDSRSVWWVAGTSAAFMFTMLGSACVIFVRRDF